MCSLTKRLYADGDRFAFPSAGKKRGVHKYMHIYKHVRCSPSLDLVLARRVAALVAVSVKGPPSNSRKGK